MAKTKASAKTKVSVDTNTEHAETEHDELFITYKEHQKLFEIALAMEGLVQLAEGDGDRGRTIDTIPLTALLRPLAKGIMDLFEATGHPERLAKIGGVQ